MAADYEFDYATARAFTHWTENANGVKTVYVYTREGDAQYTITDLDGDLATTDDQTVVGRIEYDSEGKQSASIMDRDGDLSTTGDQTVTRYHYDDKGRVTATHYADGTYTHVTYDALGRKASETDKAGNTTYYEYDDMGRLTAVVLPQVQHPVSGNMVHVRYEYGYDSRGNQISLTDNLYMDSPQGYVSRTDARTTTFTYDGHNRQTSRTLPDGLTEYFFYNDHGQQVRHLSFEGRVTVMQYDTLGRLAGKSYFASEAAWNNGQGTAGQTITYEYDAFGRVIRETDSKSGTTTTTYDAHGQVTRVESPTGVINYEYDPVTGQVTRTWTGANASNPVTDVRNTYDVHGRLETVETHARDGSRLTTPEVARYTYDVLGNLSAIRHSNGIVTTYTYDYLNRLTEVYHVHDNTPDNTADDVLVEKFEYHYHATGDKAAEFATDKDGNRNVWEWDYDALGRLINERHNNHDDSLDYTAEYLFDLVGNRLEKTTVNAEGIEKIISAFDQNDRLLNEKTIFNSQDKKQTDYRYNGTEQVGKTVTDLAANKVESKTTMEYNEQGRMSKITIDTYLNGALAKRIVQEYEYDTSGIKVRQTESVDEDGNGTVDTRKVTEYLNDAMNHTGYSQVLEERTTENGGPVKVTTYTIGHDVLAQYNAAAGFLALLADGHGSTRAVADNTGTIVQQYNYDAYGNAHGFDASQALTNLLYSGEQFNPVSGLQYLRARWYNPQTGTFNRLDPFAGNRENPLSFHKYAYANMDPVVMNDPSGNFAIIILLQALAAMSAVMMASLAMVYGSSQLSRYAVGEFDWTQDDITRFNALSGFISAIYANGAYIRSNPTDSNIPSRQKAYSLFVQDWDNHLNPAMQRFLIRYSHYSSWGIDSSKSTRGFNNRINKVYISRYSLYDAVPNAVNTLIHETYHDSGLGGFGHSWEMEFNRGMDYLFTALKGQQGLKNITGYDTLIKRFDLNHVSETMKKYI